MATGIVSVNLPNNHYCHVCENDPRFSGTPEPTDSGHHSDSSGYSSGEESDRESSTGVSWLSPLNCLQEQGCNCSCPIAACPPSSSGFTTATRYVEARCLRSDGFHCHATRIESTVSAVPEASLSPRSDNTSGCCGCVMAESETERNETQGSALSSNLPKLHMNGENLPRAAKAHATAHNIDSDSFPDAQRAATGKAPHQASPDSRLQPIASADSSACGKQAKDGSAALTDRQTVHCLAVSVWSKLDKTLQQRLDASDLENWLFATEDALHAAQWQDETLLTSGSMVLLHALLCAILNDHADKRTGTSFLRSRSATATASAATDADVLKTTILACLYVVCSYAGQEISYPSWPYLACAIDTFWSQTISVGMRFSKELLALHSDRSAYDLELQRMAPYLDVDIATCKSRRTKQKVKASVAELLMASLKEEDDKQI